MHLHFVQPVRGLLALCCLINEWMNDLQQIQFHCRYLRTKLITKYWKIETILNTFWRFFAIFTAHVCEMMQWVDWKCKTWKWRTIKILGSENVGHEIEGPNCNTRKCKTSKWRTNYLYYSAYACVKIKLPYFCATVFHRSNCGFADLELLQFKTLHFAFSRDFMSCIFRSGIFSAPDATTGILFQIWQIARHFATLSA